jgi:hypothetical protein
LDGWAPAYGKPAGKVAVAAFVDRPAAEEPDFTGIADTERADLRKPR